MNDWMKVPGQLKFEAQSYNSIKHPWQVWDIWGSGKLERGKQRSVRLFFTVKQCHTRDSPWLTHIRHLSIPYGVEESLYSVYFQ